MDERIENEGRDFEDGKEGKNENVKDESEKRVKEKGENGSESENEKVAFDGSDERKKKMSR